jgi:plasmid stabilization system protein ParE
MWTVEIPPFIWTLIRAQVHHIAKNSVAHAVRWEVRLNEAIRALAQTP